jgi:hypothetical protein
MWDDLESLEVFSKIMITGSKLAELRSAGAEAAASRACAANLEGCDPCVKQFETMVSFL